jgi:c-di-GMP-binding flagellar brake protein YcgR
MQAITDAELEAWHDYEVESRREIVALLRQISEKNQLVRVLIKGEAALRADIPPSLIRLQRREYYRMETPVSNPVRAIIPLPPELGAGTGVFPLHDISCGGIAILDNKMQLSTTIGEQLSNCRIELPEIGPVTVSLEIRNSLDLTLLNNKTNRRLGLQFVDISRGGMAGVQRYITKLERERNARLAGLA